MNTIKNAIWGSTSETTNKSQSDPSTTHESSTSQPDPSSTPPPPPPQHDEPSAESDDMASAAAQERQQPPPESHDQDEQQQQGRYSQKDQTPVPPPVSSYMMICPDPKVHEGAKLNDRALNDVLFKSRYPERDSNKHDDILDANNRLSSAGAAASLKYAKPQDLPSFPTVGINTQSSAGAAASLANANRKPVEIWHPDSVSSSAGKAAMLAKDHKMAPLWRPETGADSYKAAKLAHKEGTKVDLWTPESSKDGYSAALQASSGRRRADSTPSRDSSYPDAVNSSRNALNAATLAHRPSVRGSDAGEGIKVSPAALEAARVRNLGHNVPREMFTEHPPVAIEVEEKKHHDALHASAVSMAKQMYALQQKHIDDATATPRGDSHAAAVRVHSQPQQPGNDLRQQAVQYLHLQEAAQRLAAERLAKIKPDESSAYRDYYGFNYEPPQSRLSLRGRHRRRASSESQMSEADDAAQSRRIRNQMSTFNDKLAQVDAKKRQKDRESLLAVAEKRVHAKMHQMDERVFQETGNASPAMMQEWEAQARARVAADSEARMANYGKVYVGGGKYLDQAEVDAVAAARVKPTLDEIDANAEAYRVKQEELRLDQEERRRQAQLEKERDLELKAEHKRIRGEEKSAAKLEKELEKSRKQEEKRLAKEEKLHSKELKITDMAEARDETTAVAAVPETETRSATTTDTNTEVVKTDSSHLMRNDPDAIAERVLAEPVVALTRPTHHHKLDDPEHIVGAGSDPNDEVERVIAAPVVTEAGSKLHPTTTEGIQTTMQATNDPAEEKSGHKLPSFSRAGQPKSESKGLKSLLGVFSRKSKGGDSSETEPRTVDPAHKGEPTAGQTVVPAAAPLERTITSSSTSSLSKSDAEETPIAENDVHERGRADPRTSNVSGATDEFEEARDGFDDKLLPPPSVTSSGVRDGGSPVRDSRFQEQL